MRKPVFGLILLASVVSHTGPALAETIADIDGNVYQTVRIGSQIWMKENLRTTRLNDGTPIRNITDEAGWRTADGPAFTVYSNSHEGLIANYKEEYGLLYNGHAVASGKIAPDGWHVPTREEWNALVSQLGGLRRAGGKMKEVGTIHWKAPNHLADNSSGFSARAAGFRHHNGACDDLGTMARFWSATPSGNRMAAFCAYFPMRESWIGSFPLASGLSVRCIKGPPPAGTARPAIVARMVDSPVKGRERAPERRETVTDIDGNVYRTVKVGDQVWLREDLRVTRFNDGSPIPYVTSNAEWGSISTPAHCWYDHDSKYGKDYGALYNFWAATSGKLAPKGWHVPSADEWRTLVESVRRGPGGSEPGSRLRESGLEHWIIQNWGATDDYGFALRGGGYRVWTGYGFDDMGTYYNAFSTTAHPTRSHSALIFSSFSFGGGCGVYPDRKRNGFSIRCVRDERP